MKDYGDKEWIKQVPCDPMEDKLGAGWPIYLSAVYGVDVQTVPISTPTAKARRLFPSCLHTLLTVG